MAYSPVLSTYFYLFTLIIHPLTRLSIYPSHLPINPPTYSFLQYTPLHTFLTATYLFFHLILLLVFTWSRVYRACVFVDVHFFYLFMSLLCQSSINSFQPDSSSIYLFVSSHSSVSSIELHTACFIFTRSTSSPFLHLYLPATN